MLVAERDLKALLARAMEGSSGRPGEQSFLASNPHSCCLESCWSSLSLLMRDGLGSPSEMEGTAYFYGDGGVR